MAIRQPRVLLLTATALLLAVGASTEGDGMSGVSIHDLLREHGLPAGILPRAVESYTLERTTGLLEVRLYHPCYAKYDEMAFFDRVVRGNLSYGALIGVVGLEQEELFLWLPVRRILVSDPSSGVILFDIGLARKQLSLSLFETPPDCRPEELTATAAPAVLDKSNSPLSPSADDCRSAASVRCSSCEAHGSRGCGAHRPSRAATSIGHVWQLRRGLSVRAMAVRHHVHAHATVVKPAVNRP
ncbi:hypothetical protein AXF42_Ash011014 [Apostasia shenzhenica]|uniref:Uncharacterized protein n=1 Tax=Apostasia shenzhenica TaxID=1088818 RepID=A0A2H9ZQV5_9ASPA|nr:hypothetical protein AXF42_Ash011014 [Apostasia shenzhenica]